MPHTFRHGPVLDGDLFGPVEDDRLHRGWEVGHGDSGFRGNADDGSRGDASTKWVTKSPEKSQKQFSSVFTPKLTNPTNPQRQTDRYKSTTTKKISKLLPVA